MTTTTGSIAFSDGTTTVNLPVLAYPQDLGADRENFVITRTSGGGVKSVDWGGGADGRWFQRALAMRLTGDQYTELSDFIWDPQSMVRLTPSPSQMVQGLTSITSVMPVDWMKLELQLTTRLS